MPNASAAEAAPRHLTFLLVWAVVFCDIGTSVYYVPGILYGQVGELETLFVMATTLGFILLSAKYTEIAWRNPEGGGVVTVATKAFRPWWGCLGGLLITVDYFLTSAISSVSGMQYLGSLFPSIDATVVPILIVVLTQGNLTTLGEMYAFGLLGAFVLSSAGLDVLRWRERQRRFGFWIGLFTTAMVVLAWTVNLITKPLATFFGGGIVGFGFVFALAWKRGWLLDQVYRLPFIAQRAAQQIEEAEEEAEGIIGIVSLGEAQALLPLYPSHTLVAVREANLHLLDAAAAHEQLRGGNTFAVRPRGEWVGPPLATILPYAAV